MYHGFTSLETTKKIHEASLINITSIYESNEKYYLQVDNYKNLNYVRNEIKKLGYTDTGSLMFIMPEYEKTYATTMYIISTVTIIFCIIIKYLFNKKMIFENKKLIALNIVNGYRIKDLVCIETFKNYIIDFISLIINIFVVIFAINLYNKNMPKIVMAGYVPKFPIILFLILFIVLYLIEYIINKIIIKKLLKNNLSNLLNEE